MRDAALRLDAIDGVSVRARSRVYETEPVGGVPQPAFLNAAIILDCALEPLALLDELLRIERALGRRRGESDVRWGPRLVDLDILWIRGVSVQEPRLQVPHSELATRAFALVPMLEVAPDAAHPTTGQRYAAPRDEGVVLTALSL